MSLRLKEVRPRLGEAEQEERADDPASQPGLTKAARRVQTQGCQMAKFDPFLSLDCTRVEGVGAQSKEGKEGITFCSVA